MTILVAEDEEGDFLLLDRAFRKSGAPFVAQWVRNGMQAMHYLRGEGAFADRARFPLPAIIILDLKMPEASGMDVLQWRQAHAQFRVIPTVVMSSSDRPDDVQQAYRFGANTYFVKPRNFETLVDLCKQIGGYWHYGIKPRVEDS